MILSNIFISDYQIIDQPPDQMRTPESISNFTPYGVVTISYQSRCDIDGYWLQLGNFKNIENFPGKNILRVPLNYVLFLHLCFYLCF